MNSNELQIELVKHGLSVPAAADLIGIGKKAFYSKMKGTTQFKQSEIRSLKELLSLSNERTADIFLRTEFLKGNMNVK